MVETSVNEEIGKVLCFRKRTIDKWLENFLACLGFSASLYIGLKYVNLFFFIELDSIYHNIGYMSFLALFSLPFAFKGTNQNSLRLLFLSLLVLWYHIYCIFSYIFLLMRNNVVNDNTAIIRWDLSRFISTPVHQVTLVVYCLSLLFCLLLTIVKIISIVNQIEPSKVAVTNNNANE